MNTNHPTEEMRVLDAAFGLVTQAVAPLGQAGAKDKLQQMFPVLSSDEVMALYRRATALADACFDAGEQCRDKRMTEAQAIASLRQRFPGFSSKTYQQALGWGYFLSR
jgi:hypothetical protein